MAITVYFFGSLSDISLVSQKEFPLLSDTDALQQLLKKEFPALVSSKYFIAVNKQMIKSNCVLKEGDHVALMPPFSGG